MRDNCDVVVTLRRMRSLCKAHSNRRWTPRYAA